MFIILYLGKMAPPQQREKFETFFKMLQPIYTLLGFYPETWQVCKLSINLLTLAGLSTNISVDKPANLYRCMVKS